MKTPLPRWVADLDKRRLQPLTVIPGHGGVFADGARGHQCARRRLAGFEADPVRHARYAAKVPLEIQAARMAAGPADPGPRLAGRHAHITRAAGRPGTANFATDRERARRYTTLDRQRGLRFHHLAFALVVGQNSLDCCWPDMLAAHRKRHRFAPRAVETGWCLCLLSARGERGQRLSPGQPTTKPDPYLTN